MAESYEHEYYKRENWPQGPWTDEPDEMTWKDFTTGYECFVVRGPMGHLCGYVHVPEEHPAYSLTYDGLGQKYGLEAVSVHGGLTFSGDINGTEHWFGFDCGHSGDLIPSMLTLRKMHKELSSAYHDSEVYRTMAYCWQECTNLAYQLSKLA